MFASGPRRRKGLEVVCVFGHAGRGLYNRLADGVIFSSMMTYHVQFLRLVLAAPTTAPDSRLFFIRSAGILYSPANRTTSSDRAISMSQRFDRDCPRLLRRQPRCAQRQRCTISK